MKFINHRIKMKKGNAHLLALTRLR